MADAVVIGAGHNGLVAANVLVDAGWEVVVLEANAEPGGAVRTAELTVPGFRHDLFSAFYPLAAVSPHLVGLGLEDYGLRWCRSPLVLAHPTPDGRCAVLSTDLDETAGSLERYAPGDGDAWKELYGRWQHLSPHLIDALMRPMPPIRPALQLGRRLVGRDGIEELLRFVRFALLPVRRLAEEHFRGEGAALLLAGNALHTDLTPESAAGAIYGWLLASLGQQVGFPVPEGGAGSLITALVRRLESRGGTLRCGDPVERIEVRNGRAVAVGTAAGRTVTATRAVIADVDAPTLYRRLVGADHLPARTLEDIGRFQYDAATVKVDWALSGPVPWTAPEARRAGTVHLAESLDQLTHLAAALATRRIPARPFLIFGQQSVADPTRSPPGTETAWAYAHVPREVVGDAGGSLTGRWDEAEAATFAERMEDEIEQRAPGFRRLILGRHIFVPATMEAENPNLVGGAIGAGTAQIHQQLIFRPVPGLGRPSTPVRGLYLGSASAHPGGGVHGAPGANAARAALLAERGRRLVRAGAAVGLAGGAGSVLAGGRRLNPRRRSR